MIKRAIANGVPFSWVAADAVYGVGDIEGVLRRAGKGYALGVKSDHQFGSWAGKPAVAGNADEIARALEPTSWQRRPADLPQHHDGDLAFFLAWCSAGTAIQALVSIEGHRWAIEDSFEAAKNELGLDHNETRSWHGWHRRVSHRDARLRHDGCNPTPGQCNDAPKRQADAHDPPLIRWSIQEVRRIGVGHGWSPDQGLDSNTPTFPSGGHRLPYQRRSRVSRLVVCRACSVAWR
jgi:hypothetical protein